MYSSNAEFTIFSMAQWAQFVFLENYIGNVGER
jgi:hypothetical protein